MQCELNSICCGQIEQRRPQDNAAVQLLYKQWMKGTALSEAAREVLHTQYHKREKTVTTTIGDW